MAKQNVTFIERHVEKIILGVCGALLLGVSALYLARSPNTVEISGEALGPREFYSRFHAAAEQKLAGMKREKFEPSAEDAKRVEEILRNLRLRESDPKLPDELAVTFVMPNPPIPGIEGPGYNKIDLAAIVAPSKPAAGSHAAGRSLAVIQPATVLSGNATQAQPAMVLPNIGLNAPQPEPVFWIALSATIDRKAQRARFDAAGYDENRKSLVLAGVEARRQMLLPSGDWGPEEVVKGYSPVELGEVPRITIQKPQEGDPFVAPEDNTALEAFRSRIATYDQQASMFLRPAFQQLLISSAGDWWEWQVPRKLPGLEEDLVDDYGIAVLDEAVLKPKPRQPTPGPGNAPAPRQPAPGRTPRGPGMDGAGEGGGRGGRAGGGPAPRPAPTAAPTDPGAARDAMELMKKADEAIAGEKFMDAERHLQAVVTLPGVLEGIKGQALKKLEDHKDDIQKARKEHEARLDRKRMEMQMNFGPNIDPIWFTDTTVTPGKTYRYRLQLLALNAYAGEPGVVYLKNLDDAAKVIIPGEWSEWSDPVTAKPDKQLFAWKVENNTVQVDLWRWSGKWQGGTTKVNVGEPVVYKAARLEIPYDGTIASMEPNRPYRERIANARDGSITFRDPVPTHAVLLVNARGEVEEHLVAHDSDRLATFRKERVEEDRIKKELEGVQPQYQQQPRGGPGMMPGMPGPMPAGPGFDPGGRGGRQIMDGT